MHSRVVFSRNFVSFSETFSKPLILLVPHAVPTESIGAANAAPAVPVSTSMLLKHSDERRKKVCLLVFCHFFIMFTIFSKENLKLFLFCLFCSFDEVENSVVYLKHRLDIVTYSAQYDIDLHFSIFVFGVAVCAGF